MKLLIVTSFVFVSSLVFGEVLPPELTVPEGDPLAGFIQLFLNFKTLSPLAIGSSIVIIIVQALKKFMPTTNLTRGLAVGLSVAYGIFQAMISGLGFMQALVLVMFTLGGATLVYEYVIKPLLPAQK